jgi:hypothetical protein
MHTHAHTHAWPAQPLAALLAEGLDIRYGHRVSAVQWSVGDGEGEGAGARVTCANGAVLDADAVLVTTSIGVLQVRARILNNEFGQFIE